MPIFGRLESSHQTGSFSCGNFALDEYLRTADPEDADTEFFVLAEGSLVMGYVAKQKSVIEYELNGAPVSSVPVLYLPAIAVDVQHQKNGYCKQMFTRILVRCLIDNSSDDWELIGCLPIHEATTRLCDQFGFAPIPGLGPDHWLQREALARSFHR